MTLVLTEEESNLLAELLSQACEVTETCGGDNLAHLGIDDARTKAWDLYLKVNPDFQGSRQSERRDIPPL